VPAQDSCNKMENKSANIVKMSHHM